MSDVAWDARVTRALSAGQPVAAPRRVGAAAQHGDDGRQPPAAHALLRTSATPRCRATSASRAPAARRSTASTARTPCSARASSASRRIRRTWPSRSSRSTRRCSVRGAQRRAQRSRSPTFTCCRARIPSARRCSQPGELITGDRPARASVRDALALPQGARSRVATRSRSRRPRSRSTCRAARSATRASRSAASARSRGARTEAEHALVGEPATAATFRAAAQRRARRRAAAASDNAFKIELARRTLVRALDGGDGMSDACDRRADARRSRSTASTDASRSPAARATPPSSRRRTWRTP